MRIEPLSAKTLESAKNLLNRVFPHQAEYERSDFWLPASLNPSIYKKISPNPEVKWVKYWVAVDDANHVIGITGLYTIKEDVNEAFWLSWFCVDPLFRNRGIGSKLLGFTIKKAKSKGKKYLRLYTSTDPNEAAAQKLYEKKGFVISKRNVRNRGRFEIFYRELKL